MFDGECGFCRRSLLALKRLDWFDRIELIASSDRAAWADRFPQLEGADFAAAMFAVRGNSMYRGFDAFRASLWSLPLLAPVAWSWYLPGVRAVGTRMYAAIAARRHRLGCGDRCSL